MRIRGGGGIKKMYKWPKFSVRFLRHPKSWLSSASTAKPKILCKEENSLNSEYERSKYDSVWSYKSLKIRSTVTFVYENNWCSMNNLNFTYPKQGLSSEDFPFVVVGDMSLKIADWKRQLKYFDKVKKKCRIADLNLKFHICQQLKKSTSKKKRSITITPICSIEFMSILIV